MDVLLALDPFSSVGCYISSVKLGHKLLFETFTLNNPVLCDILCLRQRVMVLGHWCTLGTGSFWFSGL